MYILHYTHAIEWCICPLIVVSLSDICCTFHTSSLRNVAQFCAGILSSVYNMWHFVHIATVFDHFVCVSWLIGSKSFPNLVNLWIVVKLQTNWFFTVKTKRAKWHGQKPIHWSQLLSHDNVMKWKHFLRYWPLCGEFTGDRWIPRTKASDADIWCFLWSARE